MSWPQCGIDAILHQHFLQIAVVLESTFVFEFLISLDDCGVAPTATEGPIINYDPFNDVFGPGFSGCCVAGPGETKIVIKDHTKRE